MKPKSYWLECAVYRLIDSSIVQTDGISQAVLMRDMLQGMLVHLSPSLSIPGAVPEIRDPALGNNVAAKWDRSAFESFMRTLDESAELAECALNEGVDDVEAIKLWQRVFNADGNDWFPTRPDGRAYELRAAALAGNVFVETGTGRVRTARPTRPHFQVPSHRYYGKRR
jgi:hypothetical protein